MTQGPSYSDIGAAHEALEGAERAYLRHHGWKHTCSTPGSYWMWRRSFADVNARRLEAHEAFCSRIGEQREHDPYPDEMLADSNTAIRMTWTEIDPARFEVDDDD